MKWLADNSADAIEGREIQKRWERNDRSPLLWLRSSIEWGRASEARRSIKLACL